MVETSISQKYNPDWQAVNLRRVSDIEKHVHFSAPSTYFQDFYFSHKTVMLSEGLVFPPGPVIKMTISFPQRACFLRRRISLFLALQGGCQGAQSSSKILL
jgi:hypothetical protein